MRKIKLYGELGRKFGREYRLKVNSPAEAVRALCIQITGFRKYLIESQKSGISFKVYSAKNEVGQEQLGMTGTGDIRIVPQIAGANGEFRVLAGAALVAASFLPTPLSPYLFNVGVGVALGGVSEVLGRGFESTTPYEKDENRPSNSFSGPVNTLAQGHPVPVGYGRMIVGAQVISARISIKTILAGYKPKLVEDYVDLWSQYTDAPPAYGVPPNWKRRDELQKEPMYLYVENPGVQPILIGYQWKFRYYYDKTVYELVPV